MKLNTVKFDDNTVYVNGKKAGYYEKIGDTYIFYEKYSFNHDLSIDEPHSEYSDGVDYDSYSELIDDLQTMELN